MASAANTLKLLIIIMLVYSMGITIFAHSLPANTIDSLRPFRQPADTFPQGRINELTDETFLDTLDIPVINIGALVFFTGNIIVDLIINFVTALPQIFVLLLNVFTLLGVNIDGVTLLAIQGMATGVTAVLFVIGVLELIIEIRTGRNIGVV